MITSRRIKSLVKGYPEDVEAWQRALDLLDDEKTYEFDSDNTGKDLEEYFTSYYPKVRRFAEIFYVMATVPVYVLAFHKENDGFEFMTIAPSEDENDAPVLPIFIKEADAENHKNFLIKENKKLFSMKILLCMLIDDVYGLLCKDVNYRFAFVDERPGHKWPTIRKGIIYDMVYDSAKAVFGGFDYVCLPEEVQELLLEKEDETEMMEPQTESPKAGPPLTWSRFSKKPPVS